VVGYSPYNFISTRPFLQKAIFRIITMFTKSCSAHINFVPVHISSQTEAESLTSSDVDHGNLFSKPENNFADPSGTMKPRV
jgi:hypothetical protein